MAQNPNTGAQKWGDALNGQPQPAQPSIPMIHGGPNGVVYAPVGSFCLDERGRAWAKTTSADFNTGWTQLVAGGASGGNGLILRDAPSTPEPEPDNPDLPARLIFRNGAPELTWDPDFFTWI